MSTVRTIEQKRSEFALKCVKDIAKDKTVRGNYKGLVKKFPMMVLKNGLLQTIAFMEAKGKIKSDSEKGQKQHKELYKHIKAYLTKISPLSFPTPENQLLSDSLSKISVAQYRNITSDILAFAKWLGKYAEALIKEEAKEE